MKKIVLSIILLAGLYITPAFAQSKSSYSIEYTMGFATGDLKDFIGKASFRGATFEYRQMQSRNLGIGFEIGWSAFFEKYDYETFTDGTRSISGTQYRYVSAVPMLLNANYYFKPGENINPFVGIGLGTMYTANEVDMGIYAFEENEWHFAWKPEIGVVLNPGAEVGIMISAKYYNALKTQDIGSRSYISANVGLVWGL